MKWVAQPDILTWFWDRTNGDRMLGRRLEDNTELVLWCRDNDCGINSSWVQCPDEETFLMFGLRWIGNDFKR